MILRNLCFGKINNFTVYDKYVLCQKTQTILLSMFAFIFTYNKRLNFRIDRNIYKVG